MKIGADGWNLASGWSGISRYLTVSAELLRAQADVRVFVPPPVRPDRRVGPGALARRMYWGQVELPRLARRDGIDVLWGPAHRLPLRLDPRIARVVTIHDLVWLKTPQTMRARQRYAEALLMTQAVRSADAIIAVSHSTADDIRKHFGRRARRVVVIPPSPPPLVPDASASPRSRFGLTRPYALFVGTLEPRKNVIRLLDAYASLDADVRRRCMLVLAGQKGWKLPDIAPEIERRGLGDSVRWLGFVTDGELSGLYRDAMFLAMPSLYEGFGLPILEANRAGIAVLTSDLSSMPEVAGKAGHFVDPRSVDSIAAGLRRLITDGPYRETLASAALANAARYDGQRNAQDMLSLFEELIAERRAGRRN